MKLETGEPSSNGGVSEVNLGLIITTSSGDRLAKKSVLVVEDSGVIRSILTKALRDIGMDVHEAKDGVEAVEIHKGLNPDLTIMDLIMPKMGGLDAMVQIRETSPDAKFIVLTSSARRDEVVTAKTLNLVDYVIKPVQMGDFVIKVKSGLGIGDD